MAKSAATAAPSAVRAQYQSVPSKSPFPYHLRHAIVAASESIAHWNHRNSGRKSPRPEPAIATASAGILAGRLEELACSRIGSCTWRTHPPSLNPSNKDPRLIFTVGRSGGLIQMERRVNRIETCFPGKSSTLENLFPCK